MADEILVVGSEFDPSGLASGLAAGEQALKKFETTVRQLDEATGKVLDVKALGQVSAKAFRDAQAATAAYNQRIQSAIESVTGLTRAVNPMAASMAQANSGNARFAEGLRNLAAANQAAATGFAVSNRSVNLLRGGLAQLAVQATGASGPLGQIAQSFAFMAGGTTAAIGFAAALGGLALAYQAITKAAREAAKAQQEHLNALRGLINEDTSPLATHLAAVTKQAHDLEQQIAAAKQRLGEGGIQGSTFARTEIQRMESELARLKIEVGLGNDLFLAGERAKQEALKATTHAQHVSTEAVKEFRNATRGSGNLTQGAGGTNTGPIRGGLLSGAGAEDITNSRAAAVIGRNEAALASLFATWSRGWRIVARDASEAARQQAEIAQSLTDMGTIAFGLADVGRALGGIGENAIRTLESVGRLSDALAAVATNASFGNIVGAAAAGLSVLGGLFGETATAREHAAIVRQNNDRLLELKLSLDTLNFDSPLAGRTREVFGVDLSGTHTGGQAELDAALARAGLTLEEFAASVERLTGIQILDSEGNLMGKAWRQAREGFERAAAEYNEAVNAENLKRAQEQAAQRMADLGAAAREAAAQIQALADAAAREFEQALPNLLELRRRLTGTADDLQQQFDDALAGLVPITATSGLLEQFQGIDLSDPAAREELHQQLLDMINQLLAGTFPLQDQSQFGPLLEFLNQAVGVLDGFNESVQDATKSLTNMPHGINLAALEFQAQAAGVTRQRPGTAGFPNEGAGVGFPIRRGTDGAQLPIQTFTQTVMIDRIVVEGGTNVSPEETAVRIKEALKRESMAKFGTPDKWGQ